MSTRLLFTALCATALTLPVSWGQTETPATDVSAAPASQTVTVAGAEPTAKPASRDKDTLSVDFPDEDIKTILRNVADLFELNLVVPDTLVGKTSIKLRDVTWRQIFQVVLAPVGFTYVEEGNIIKIVSNELLQQEPGTTEVFILNNAKAADIKPTIDGLIDAATGGKIVIDARSNALVITERPSRMKRIRDIVVQLDKATDQVMIESKFVEVTDRDIRNIGVNWASLQGMQFGVGGINQAFSRSRGQEFTSGNTTSNDTTNGTTNTNTTTTTSGTTNGTTNGTSNVVTNSTTVSYGSTFTPTAGNTSLPSGSVTLSNNNPTSVTAQLPGAPTTTVNNINTNGTSGSTTGTTSNSLANSLIGGSSSSTNNVVNALTGLTNTGGTSRLASAVFSASDFNVIVSALKTQNNTKIVSNPTIVTLNNTEASINIGQEFPVPSYTYNSERGSFEVSGFVYKPIGINLKVTPQVNARGLIKLTLEPEVSQQNGSTSFGGAGGAQIPIVATRKVKTQVSLQDGETMGIGGLITSSLDHGGTKVPVLGNIPILGRLFSSKNVNDTATNLLIFITAKTLKAEGGSIEDVFDPRSIQAVGMTKEDLPGNRAPKGTDLFLAPAPLEKK